MESNNLGFDLCMLISVIVNNRAHYAMCACINEPPYTFSKLKEEGYSIYKHCDEPVEQQYHLPLIGSDIHFDNRFIQLSGDIAIEHSKNVVGRALIN